MDLLTLSLAKKYTDDATNGLGAVKGANATIENITPVDGGNNVTFAWTGTDGKKQTQTMFVANGQDGRALLPEDTSVIVNAVLEALPKYDGEVMSV